MSVCFQALHTNFLFTYHRADVRYESWCKYFIVQKMSHYIVIFSGCVANSLRREHFVIENDTIIKTDIYLSEILF